MALILSFKDKETESFYHSGKSKVFLQEIQKRALLKLDTLSYATNIKDLKAPPSNHLEKLSGNLQGFYNIRINVKYRIIFKFDTNAKVSIQEKLSLATCQPFSVVSGNCKRHSLPSQRQQANQRDWGGYYRRGGDIRRKTR